jgi:hypothetical protein
MQTTTTTTTQLSSVSTDTPATGQLRRWIGRVISGLVAALLAFDAIAKLVAPPAVIEGSAELGYRAASLPVIGVILLACVIVYAIPRTAVLGAVLLTGYLGGAIATHLRVDNPLLSHTLFPIYVACAIWGGLVLRDRRLWALIRR